MKKFLCLLLILSTCIICSCSQEAKYQDLMKNITPSAVSPEENIEGENKAYTEFAVELFKKSLSEDGKNTLISPLSVIYALGLTANGADGNTLSQMEDVLNFNVSDLNNYLYSYAKQKAKDESATLSIANSIWFIDDEERLKVNHDFLQKNADYYNAAANRADFSDPDTVKDINNWVKDNTKGMIPEIVSEIEPDNVMFLINALAFEAEWEEKYKKGSIKDGTFTLEDGTKQKVEFMHSDEYRYIGDENSKGFMKNYKGKYAFAALLPNEGISIDEFVSTLSGEKITNILTTLGSRYCITSMPKFETEYNVEMAEIFKSLGMTDAFIEGVADFSKMGEAKELHIDNIIHKTFISVGELGTKAGAATAVIMSDGGMFPSEITEIHLNRPFVYMLVDTENNIPLFMGTLMSVK
ncbi:MAG: serine protease [Ruminococcaceae bacterium]|nr:serine protease [Oscillospiraceae bacterium]